MNTNIKRLTLYEMQQVMLMAFPDDNPGERGSTRDVLLSGMAALKTPPQIFDFGVTDHLGDNLGSANKKMAATLWYRGLLRLPFPVTIFTFRQHAARITMLCIENAQIDMADSTQVEHATAIFMFSQGPNQLGRIDLFSWFRIVDEANHVKAGATELTPCEGETGESFRAYAMSGIARVMTLSVFLNTKGLRVRQEGSPTKLNAKRARSGKPPLDAVTYVDTSAFGGSRSASGSGREMPMHFRRGHIRHLGDGTITWVRDAIIKADGALKARERYEVRGALTGRFSGEEISRSNVPKEGA